MADLHLRVRESGLRLRREVIVPPQRDGVAFYRTIAVLSITIAMIAGMVDTMLWHSARRQAMKNADQQRVERALTAADLRSKRCREAAALRARAAVVNPAILELDDDLVVVDLVDFEEATR